MSRVAPRAGIAQLPDELLLHIFAGLSAKDVPQVAHVCRRWQFLAQDAALQRAIFLPELRAPLGALATWSLRTAPQITDVGIAAAAKARGTSHCGGAMPKPTLQRCLARANKDVPAALQVPLMYVAWQAKRAARQVRRCERSEAWARTLATGAWRPLVYMVAAGFGLSLVFMDQGATHNSPAFVQLGLAVGTLTLMFAASTPILWLVYNCVGVIAEELAHAQLHRLHRDFDMQFAHVAALLQPFT